MIKEKMLEYLCLGQALTRPGIKRDLSKESSAVNNYVKVDMTGEQRTVLLNRYLSLEDELVNQYRLPSDILELTGPK